MTHVGEAHGPTLGTNYSICTLSQLRLAPKIVNVDDPYLRGEKTKSNKIARTWQNSPGFGMVATLCP